MKNYFDEPTQVMFADPDNCGKWLAGIAYKDEIICACCGGVFNIEDVIDMAGEDGIVNPIYSYNDWLDISSEICGGEMPEGLEVTDNGVIEVADESVEDEEVTEYESYYYKDLE